MRKHLTNRQLIGILAKLPPDDDAVISIIDGDGGIMTAETLWVTEESDLNDVEEPDPELLGKPHIFRKW